MREWLRGWTTAQRVVVVVAWAGVLQAISTWVLSDGWRYQFGDDDDWYNSAPNSGVAFSGGGPPWWMTNPTATMLIRFAFIVVWLAPSIWLLAARRVEQQPDDTDEVGEAA